MMIQVISGLLMMLRFKGILFMSICFVEVSSLQDTACGVGDFCTYKCHCDKPCAGTDGLCPIGSKCVAGWFGLRCQYQDLTTTEDAQLTTYPSQDTSWLIDRNDSTCNSDPDLKSVTVSWSKLYPLTWIRISITDISYLSSISIHYNASERDTECIVLKFSLLDGATADIRCYDEAVINSLTVTGNITSLCSLYISGGRNIAFRQTTAQSSTYKEGIYDFVSGLAVDGNTNSNFVQRSCSHTDISNSPPYFKLMLQTAYIVNRCVLFNRGDVNGLRLNGFLLLTQDASNETVDRYKDNSTTNVPVYYVRLNATRPITSITVNDTKKSLSYDSVPFVTLCEIEAFGECPPGRWSLQCTKQCNSSCPTSCHIDDGSCNSVCAGFSNPPYCSNVCDIGQWGINCNNNCSNKCVDLSCDSKTGLCDHSCIGYRDPPYCNLECANDTWGINCSHTCSKNCYSFTCNAMNATCENGCKAGYQLPDCTKACSFGYWGINCSSKCHDNCLNSECDYFNGSCTAGCVEGFQLSYCTKGCENGTYGRNCSLNCSVNCLDILCNTTSGSCYKCQTGYEGTTCEREIDEIASTSQPVGVIVGPIVAAIIAVIVVFTVIIVWRKRRILLKKKKSTNSSNRLPSPYLMAIKVNDGDVSESHNSLKSEYINTQETENTLITIESLASYLASKDDNFYIKQFEKIPAAKNVTQEVGHSQENKQKNRYKNICPYDHSRVHLEINTEKNETDYINASYIRGFNGKVIFIAAQGPQKASLIDFIRMLWEQKVEVMVMLTDLIEEAKIKCEKYWPDAGKIQVGHIKIKLGSTQVFADYTIRKLELSMVSSRNTEGIGESTHNITQFHYTSWPDKGVPSTQWSLVDVEQHVTAIVTNRPILVHCSAGVGRTGTFIALYNIMRQAEETGCVDFFKTVSKLREDRIFMVQTVSQYEFLHKAAHVAIACMRTTLNIHDFSDRLKILEEEYPLRVNKIELEFNGLCDVLQIGEKHNVEEGCIYQNAGNESIVKKTESEIYEQKEIYSFSEFLPGYKHKDQYVTAKYPKSQLEATELWKTIKQNNILLVVAFEIDQAKETFTNYIPDAIDQQLVVPPYEIKLSEVSQKSLWEEQKVLIHCRKSANFLPVSQHNSDALTHLKCFSVQLDPKKWLEIAKKIRLCSSHTGGKTLFMRSDGVSLSGFMIVLSILLDRVDNECCLSVPLVVGTVRSLHPKILTSLDQYRALYHIVKRHIETSVEYTNMEFTNYQKMDTKDNSHVNNDNNILINEIDTLEKNNDETTEDDAKKIDSFLYANII